MSPSITIDELQLEAFRVYLKPQTFTLHRKSSPLSLAVFAPNARGKSSLVDSFEYYFSDLGTLERLGNSTGDSNAGPIALSHVDAETSGSTPRIHLQFRDGPDSFGDERLVVSDRSTRLPGAAKRVLANTKVPFVIRGYQLRRFVEDTTPQGRYKEIASWFGLEPLDSMQTTLRQLRIQLRNKAESSSEREERLNDLRLLTDNSRSNWDEEEVRTWFVSKFLTPLDEELTLASLSTTDSGYEELLRRKLKEEEELGVSELNRLISNINQLYGTSSEQTNEPTGDIVSFERSMSRYTATVEKEDTERQRNSDTVFRDVWDAAKALLDSAPTELDVCPVCETPLGDTLLGSHAQIHLSLTGKLEGLAEYRRVEQELRAAKKELEGTQNDLQTRLQSLVPDLNSSGHDATAVSTYLQLLNEWKVGDDAPNSTAAKQTLTGLRSSIVKKRDIIEAQQGNRTYAHAVQVFTNLVRIQSDVDRIQRTKNELRTLNDELTRQAQVIGQAIADHTQSLIARLENDVKMLYEEIQGPGAIAPPIYFQFPKEDNRNQQRVQLFIDFSDNRQGVVPSGYLSDSQIHTLGLALRLAAIRLLNRAAPIIVLDDVVTSYDADHRNTIAAVLANHFGDFQIIVVTHDEQFFLLLKDHLPEGRWLFRRITEVNPGYGPLFDNHRTPDEDIQAKLDSGESAAALMRQSEEEWLVQICRDFRTSVDMRPLDRAYQFERVELADSLAQYMNEAGLTPPSVSGVSNRFLGSLRSGVVENLGSHFSDNPYRSSSVGDDRARWKEFTFFRDQFGCPKCGGRRFMRPRGVAKPLCKKCETSFAFAWSTFTPEVLQ